MEELLETSSGDASAEKEAAAPAMLDALALSVCEFDSGDKTFYRIYVNATDYELVEAATAAEAIQQAEEKPHKVLRESKDNYLTIPRKKLLETVEGKTLYTDPQNTTDSGPTMVTFDVQDVAADDIAFQAFDLTGLARGEESTEAAVKKPAPSQAESAAPAEPKVEQAAVEQQAAPEPQPPEDEDSPGEELSPEEVAELLGES